jgi:hypothetical protein
MAGFEVSINGRIWVFTEEWRNRWRAAGERGLINCGIWVSTEAHAPAASFGL